MQAPQYLPRTVDVVDAPPSIPGAILLLGLLQETDRPLDLSVLTRNPTLAHRLQHPARDIRTGGI